MESRYGLEIACAAMARSPLFQGIEPDELTRIAQTMARRRYRRLEVIFHEGDPGDALHVVVAGRVKITRQSLDGDEAIIVTLGSGESFGEIVLLDGAARSATATAMEPTETVVLTRANFERLVDGGSPFRWSLLGGVAHRLRRLTDQLAEVHFLDIGGRLALTLSRLAEEAAPGATADVRLARPLTQTDLAAMVGGTRQRVNQILGELADEGLVAVESGVIVVRNVPALRNRAGW
ncbi:MAG TPA: Crp/Fnr family transcriptional regulator [Candidatus Limnocylindrales bacterium]|nr:Crp/Fnr family transcriptional regulator [Candidatus Limnocylindrales bacterium]